MGFFGAGGFLAAGGAGLLAAGAAGLAFAAGLGAVLGLAAFMLAFAFGAVSSRFDARKELVRDDANAIRTAWARADFLPEADRAFDDAAAFLRVRRPGNR